MCLTKREKLQIVGADLCVCPSRKIVGTGRDLSEKNRRDAIYCVFRKDGQRKKFLKLFRGFWLAEKFLSSGNR